MDPEQLLVALVFVIGMFSGVFVIFLAMRQRAHALEMQHRERMAMIERGQVPLDPPRSFGMAQGTTAGMRSITLGIVVIAIGFGLMSIVGIAAEAPSIGVGIGGAICLVGGAFIASGMLRRNQTVSDRVEAAAPLDRRVP
jgi:hypothetical protein